MAPMARYARRAVDLQATLVAYTNRLLSLKEELFESLNGCWLSSYDLWDSFTKDQLIEEELALRRFTHLDSSVLVLFQFCVIKGINVLGVTSERLVKGQHIAAIPVVGGREGVTTVYVGEHNAFSNKKRHPLFSILTQDKRYV
jgi:hypothetical protein